MTLDGFEVGRVVDVSSEVAICTLHPIADCREPLQTITHWVYIDLMSICVLNRVIELTAYCRESSCALLSLPAVMENKRRSVLVEDKTMRYHR